MAKSSKKPEFTDRELQIARLLGQGKSNAEISEALSLSEATIRTNLATLARKAGDPDRITIIMHLQRRGLL